MFYQSRRALPISSLRLAKHSVEKGGGEKKCTNSHKKVFCGCWCNFFSPPPCGDVAGQHGEVKSERSVTAFKYPAGVSVLNPEGGTSSSGSVWAQVRSFFAHHGVCLPCMERRTSGQADSPSRIVLPA